MRIKRMLGRLLFASCRHKRARADMLEGCALPLMVAWCPDCGAVSARHENDWRGDECLARWRRPQEEP